MVYNVGKISHLDGRDILIEVVGVHLENKTSNIFGQGRKGTLSVKGRLAKMVKRRPFIGILVESILETNIKLYENHKSAKDTNNDLNCMPVTKLPKLKTW
jgi:hypothetical protein